MNPFGLFAMAVEGLFRKKGRNALTTLGIVIAILSLTLVISAGKGMDAFIDGELKQEQNLVQVAVHPGFGTDMGDIFSAVEVEGEMSEAKRNRIRRAIINRRTPQNLMGRKTKIITDEALRDFGKIDHVASVRPLIQEKYDIRCEGKESRAVTSLALSHENRRHERRLIAGRFFSASDAREVVVHEHLLYTWKVTSDAQQAAWVGKEIEIKPLRGGGFLDSVQGFIGNKHMPFNPEGMLSAPNFDLTDEERDVIQGLAGKILTGMKNAADSDATRSVRKFKIVGVIRDFEPEDGNLQLLEDGAALLADLFLPLETSRSIFLESPYNLDQGYSQAIVVADSPEHAKTVRNEIQKKGFFAVSVGALLEKLNSVFMALTIYQTFLTSIILLVAGLGIMTTMITSVVERTREIGTWKAIGATDGQVLLVFLTESALVGFVGSVIGLLTARLLMIPGNMLGRHIIAQKTTFLFSGEIFVLPTWVLVLAPIFATLIGITASLYPAMRAARINPVSALRHD
ncbi:MAG: ABC transporter permease [Planctomycetota bacterium]|jgi:ABC-type antimicrobial peptide transport system permease subunit